MDKLPAAIPDMPWITVIDRDHVQTRVDGAMETFSRRDVYGGHPMSGLAHFGPVTGDWRSIQDICDDITAAFREIDR